MSVVAQQHTPYLPLVGRSGVALCDAGVGAERPYNEAEGRVLGMTKLRRDPIL
jgi:hypothetical protein